MKKDSDMVMTETDAALYLHIHHCIDFFVSFQQKNGIYFLI